MNTFCQDQEDENYNNNGNCRMKGKKQKEIIKANKPFSIRVLYIRYGVYDIMFTYQETTVFQPISDEQYKNIGSCVICALSGLKTIFLTL